MSKKNSILNVALELFGHRGFEGTSVRDIALKSKVNLAMINYYFGSKKKIKGGIADKTFRKVDPELTVATIIGTINQLVMSEALCRKLIQKNKVFNPYQSKKFKERVGSHLKQLMRFHLLTNHKSLKN